MANNALALGIKAPVMPDPVEAQNNSMAYATNMMKLQATIKAQKDEQALRDVYNSPDVLNADGTLNSMVVRQRALAGGRGDILPSLVEQEYKLKGLDLTNQGTAATTKKTQADTDKLLLETAATRHDDVLKRMSVSKTPEAWTAQATALKQQFPDMAGEIDNITATMPKTQAEYDPWYNDQMRSALAMKERLARVRANINAGDRTVMTSQDEFGTGGAVSTDATITNGVSQDVKYATDNAVGTPVTTTTIDPTTGQPITHTYILRPGDQGSGEIGADAQGNAYVGTQPMNARPGSGRNPYAVVLGNGTYSGAQRDWDPSSKTMGEVYDFGRNVLIPNTKKAGVGVVNGKVLGSSAQGAYQIVGTTMARYAQQMYGANWRNMQFTPQVQDAIAERIFNDAKKSGAAGLMKQWASLDAREAKKMMGQSWAEAKNVITQGEAGSPVGSVAGPQTREQLGITPIGGKPGAGANRAVRSAAQEDKWRKGASVDLGVVNGTQSQANTLFKTIDRLAKVDDKTLGDTMGYSSMIPTFMRGDATKTVVQQVEALKSQVETFGRTLAVAQGGKLGNMAVQEWAKVGGAVANINMSAMTPAQFRITMTDVRQRMAEALDNIRQSYVAAYGADIGTAKYNAFIPKGMTAADFAGSEGDGGSVGAGAAPAAGVSHTNW